MTDWRSDLISVLYTSKLSCDDCEKLADALEAMGLRGTRADPPVERRQQRAKIVYRGCDHFDFIDTNTEESKPDRRRVTRRKP